MRAQAAPLETFRVIVETSHRKLIDALAYFAGENGQLKRTFTSIDGINAKIPAGPSSSSTSTRRGSATPT